MIYDDFCSNDPHQPAHGHQRIPRHGGGSGLISIGHLATFMPSPRLLKKSNTPSSATPNEGIATERVVRHVSDLIMRGDLRPGQRLSPERSLVAEIGVSRTSVRTGLRALAAKGVLVIRHGAGTFVADGPPVLDSEPLRFQAALHGFTRHTMFEARRTLEIGVAGLAAERATGNDLAAISDEVTGMFASIEDPQAFHGHDIRFHRAVAIASGNPILASLVEMVSGASLARELALRLRVRDANGREHATIAATLHRQLYHAIRDRDRPRAERIMREHLLAAEAEQESEAQRDDALVSGTSHG
jgi:GntR family transcriptional repressor for pyruvate dehydrogenase complex